MEILYRRNENIADFFLAAYFSAVCISDWREGRIYNSLNVLGAVTAVWLCILCNGCSFITRVGEGLTVLAVFLIFNMMGCLGGGDVKCFGVIGVMCGMARAMKLIVVALIIAVTVWVIGGIAVGVHGSEKRHRRVKLGIYMPLAHLITIFTGGV